MSGRIHLLNGAELVAMDEQPYDSEDLLQKMLANYPDFLTGEQINSDDPRRWLLVTRSMSTRKLLLPLIIAVWVRTSALFNEFFQGNKQLNWPARHPFRG